MRLLPEHINRAVRECCPHGKQTCIMADLDACAAVDFWRIDHKAFNFTVEMAAVPKELLFAARSKGGHTTAMRRLVNAL